MLHIAHRAAICDSSHMKPLHPFPAFRPTPSVWIARATIVVGAGFMLLNLFLG